MRRWAWVAISAFGALASICVASVEMEARAGTQQCNTECQSKMTDCILACDGMRSCEEACKKKGQSCVAACSSDAGPIEPDIDGGTDAPLDRGVPDARPATANDAARRAAARDR
jgi:hypothetical protein